MKQVIFLSKKFVFIFLVFCIVVSFTAVGQIITQPVRLELEANSFNDELLVLPLLDSTLLVYKHPYSGSFREDHQFQRFGQDLQLLWTSNVELKRDQIFHKVVTHRDFTYVLYLSYRPNEFFLLKLNNKTGTHTLSKHDLKELDLNYDTQLNEFQVIKDNVFILAEGSRNFFVIHLNPKTNELKTIPALFEQLSSLSSYSLDTTVNRAEFVYSESNGIKGRLQIKRISPEGALISTHFIQPTTKRNLIDANLTPGDSLSKLLIGTYAIRDFQFAQGLFTGFLLRPEAGQQFYEFTALKHFFDYLGKRGQHRIYHKAARYKSNQKELKLRYRLSLNEVREHNDTLYLFAEAYTPRYDEDPLMSSIRSIPRRSFAGYRYSHSFVCAFNKKGELLWDNSYPLKDAETYELAQVAQHGFAGSKIIMAYTYNDKIRYKIIDHSKSSDNHLDEEIKPSVETTKIVSTEESDFKHWYGENFIAFGFQRVRPAGQSGKEVFYINKITFNPDALPVKNEK